MGGSTGGIGDEVGSITLSFFDTEELLTLVGSVLVECICTGMVDGSLHVYFIISSIVSHLSLTQNRAILTHDTLWGRTPTLVSAFSSDFTCDKCDALPAAAVGFLNVDCTIEVVPVNSCSFFLAARVASVFRSSLVISPSVTVILASIDGCLISLRKMPKPM